MRIISIGCGNMGSAILSAVALKIPGCTLGAVDPDEKTARSRLPADQEIEFWPEVEQAQNFQPDIVLMAFKPQDLQEIGRRIGTLWPQSLFISILAGSTIASLSAALKTRRIIRVMPNLPALVRQAMSVCYADEQGVEEEDIAAVQQMFETLGDFAWVGAEEEIDACTAISGSGPGYLFSFAQHMVQAALDVGVSPEFADRMVRQTICGAAAMLKADRRSAEVLKNSVASKGGTTESALRILDGPEGLEPLLRASIRGAYLRARELGGQ